MFLLHHVDVVVVLYSVDVAVVLYSVDVAVVLYSVDVVMVLYSVDVVVYQVKAFDKSRLFEARYGIPVLCLRL